MLQIECVTSLERPELWAYRTLRWRARHLSEGVFVAEGAKVVQLLLQSPLHLQSLLLTQRWLEVFRPLLASRTDADPPRIFVADAGTLDRLTGIRHHQRVLACARIPEAPLLGSLLGVARRPWLLAATEAMANAENLGALIRNTAAFDGTALLLGEQACQPWLRRVVRTSMGAIFTLPVLRAAPLVPTLHELRRRGVRCIAAHPEPAARTLPEIDLTGDVCLLFGSEGHGLSSAALEACDVRMRIPMKPGFDSLNVVSAAAICLQAAAWQQGRTRAPR